MRYNIEQFRTALLTDKVNNYWARFTEEEWEDILNLAGEKIFDEDYEAELYEANTDAYADGYDEGYENGKQDGWDYGYDSGRTDGYSEGYSEGRSDRIEDDV